MDDLIPVRGACLPVLLLAALAALAACGPTSLANSDGGFNAGDGGDGGTGACTEGTHRCDGNSYQTCTGGVWTSGQQCANACDSQLGCVMCKPGTGMCQGQTSHVCKADGSGYKDVACDPAEGLSCNSSTGLCDGACSAANLGNSYIGCEYYATVTAQAVSSSFAFAVAVSNTAAAPANITIDGGALTAPLTFTVPAGSVSTKTLPWVPKLKLCNGSGAFGCTSPQFDTNKVAKGAYRLRSDRPVTVYQFSPKDYTDGSGNFTYSNDASLLLPVNALTGTYYVAAWQAWQAPNFTTYPGVLAVTATADNTKVTITPKAPATGSLKFPAGKATTVTLDRGDVVQLANLSGDLTGSKVEADHPVSVIGGHYCTYVPVSVPACDHLEESMFPYETLSDAYIVTAPAVPSLPNGKEEMVRIVATAAATQLTFDPPLTGVATSLAKPGDFVEIPRQAKSFEVSANHKILVAQYMEGQNAGGNTGDPAMALAVATDQYRSKYLFHAPTNYSLNYVDITAPTGATVMLDGKAVTGFTAIGSSGFGVARVQLTNGTGNDGNHQASSSKPFGISVYGYGQYTSYWYPGGLNLAKIVVQ